ncbi:MAG: molybdopterin molybdotransferase MoeA, partial [Thermoleophilaceae bacterium]|nr:molybdopterin molybdotransferase MoeA [Thermoleophilaceae bacterium]
ANVRGPGEDMRAGEVVIATGASVGPAEIAVLASVGRPEVRCARRPSVAVLTTGDELVEPGTALGPGQIRNSNGYAIAAQARAAGAEVVMRRLVPDDHDATRAALAEAMDAVEVVCVSGGVSVGEHDHVKPALTELGAEEIFWRVRLKPGKPTWFGRRGNALVFGLPGNPVSAMVTFHLFAHPALRALLGADPAQPAAEAMAGEPFPRDPERDQAVRCSLEAGPGGWRATSTGTQNSHILTSMLGAQALALVTAGEGEIAPGERLAVMLLP